MSMTSISRPVVYVKQSNVQSMIQSSDRVSMFKSDA